MEKLLFLSPVSAASGIASEPAVAASRPEKTLELLNPIDAIIIGIVDGAGKTMRTSEIYNELVPIVHWSGVIHFATVHKIVKRMIKKGLLGSSTGKDKNRRSRTFVFVTTFGKESAQLTFDSITRSMTQETLEDWSVKWKMKKNCQQPEEQNSKDTVKHGEN